jgi:glycosyltransferase involved in cell wall biosynthesis
MAKVSIIISNLNYGAFLRSSIESALQQTHQPCEVIVVDDGSSDNSRRLLAGFEDRAKIFYLPHKGETSTRNAGFAASTGDLVCFLDADDYLLPDAAARVVSFWRPEFSKVQYPLKVVDETGAEQGLLMPRCQLDSGAVSPALLRTGRYITSPGSGNFYPRWFLEKIIPVPTETWPQSFDSYAATHAGFSGEIGAIQEPLGFYRVHRNNISRVASSRAIEPAQIDRLIERQFRLRDLIQQIAKEKGLVTHPDIVTSHWLYLKLALAQLSFRHDKTLVQVLGLLRKMIASASSAPELSFAKRIQLISWAIGSALLPATASGQILRMGFDLAPESKLVRMMRRL